MGRWRAKLVSTLFVYGAGFLSAIYVLAPHPKQSSGTSKRPTSHTIDRERLIQRVNEGLHDCVDFGKEAAGRMAVAIRDHMNQSPTTSNEGS